MLNTYYHSKEDIEKAYSMTDESLEERDAYASILIFCNFNKELADKYYGQLLDKGTLFLSDIMPWASDDLGWSIPWSREKHSL